MARELYSFDVTFPAGGDPASPVTTNLSLPARQVAKLQVTVPPGPAGAVGFAFAFAGVHVIPKAGAAWIVADDEVFDWDLTDYPTSGTWQVIGYNVGNYDHTIYVRLHADLVSDPVATLPAQPFALVDLAAAPSEAP